MASLGGVSVMLSLMPMMSFYNWFFPRNRSQIFSASLTIVKTINSVAGPVSL
jgi:hypothetical protein